MAWDVVGYRSELHSPVGEGGEHPGGVCSAGGGGLPGCRRGAESFGAGTSSSPCARRPRAQLRHAAAERRALRAVIAVGLKPAATCAKGPSSWAFWDGRPTKVGLSQRLPQASA
jgi:hypothetical protein